MRSLSEIERDQMTSPFLIVRSGDMSKYGKSNSARECFNFISQSGVTHRGIKSENSSPCKGAYVL